MLSFCMSLKYMWISQRPRIVCLAAACIIAHKKQLVKAPSARCRNSLLRRNPQYLQRTLWYFTSRHSSNGCCTAAWLVVRKNKPFNILFLSVIFQYSKYLAFCLCWLNTEIKDPAASCRSINVTAQQCTMYPKNALVFYLAAFAKWIPTQPLGSLHEEIKTKHFHEYAIWERSQFLILSYNIQKHRLFNA